MSVKVGYDIDGVLANFVDGFLQEGINTRLGTNFESSQMSAFSFQDSFGIDKLVETEEFNRLRDNGLFERLQPYNDMIDSVKKLDRYKLDIYFITHRSKRAIEQTYQWFMKYDIPMGKGIYFTPMDRTPTKGELATYLGIEHFIDDCYANCIEMKSHGIKTYVMNRPWNNTFDNKKDGIYRINNGEEFTKKMLSTRPFLEGV